MGYGHHATIQYVLSILYHLITGWDCMHAKDSVCYTLHCVAIINIHVDMVIRGRQI